MKAAVALIGVCLVATVLSVVAGAQPEMSAALVAMVETEREFARTALVKGVRDAFLEFFADDAIAFSPEPVSAKERLRSRPAQPPSVQELKWEPRMGDVSSSGDLGWLTGPATLVSRPGREPTTHYSNYLSVWRKQPDGHWRVFIDFGISVPKPAQYERGFVRFPFEGRYRGGQGATAAAGTLLAADRELNERLQREGAPRGYRDRLVAASRFNRDNVLPIVGPSAIATWLERNTPAVTAHSGASAVSEAGDLGYTYGTYELVGNKLENGAYLRIWTRDADGRWWIAADVAQQKR